MAKPGKKREMDAVGFFAIFNDHQDEFLQIAELIKESVFVDPFGVSLPFSLSFPLFLSVSPCVCVRVSSPLPSSVTGNDDEKHHYR